MDPLWVALALATAAGASIPLGAALATVPSALPDWLKTEARHGIIAFGAGALLAAVALVLVPEGSERLPPVVALAWFFLGGIGFAVMDRLLARRGGQFAQFLAMMMDYVPEAMALGALVTGDLNAAFLVAGLIALQNLPEGFNAMRELSEVRRVPLRVFFFMVPLGPLAAFIGLSLPPGDEHIIGAVMMFASGGILFLMFQDIAPQIPLENEAAPTFGAILGFGLGLAGHLLI
jgi:ZIP family zinc transporter